jgi:hypothetical protein
MARPKVFLGLAAVIACVGLAIFQPLPEWSAGAVARRARVLFQEYPGAYALLGYGALVALLVQVALPLLIPRVANSPNLWTSRTAFVLLTVATVMLLRWPGLAPLELNPDESEELAIALTLREDPRYWLSAEAGTHGPLVAFALLPVQWFGMQLEYGAARLVGLGLMLGSIFFLFGTLRSFFPEFISRAALLPLTLCIAFLREGDYLAYNAEHPTILLLCAGAYGCARLAAGAAGGIYRRAAATGLALGLVPFSKLQGVPIGLALAVCALLVLLTRFRGQPRKQGGAGLALCAGGVLPAALVAVYLWRQDLFAHFWTNYIIANLVYTNSSGMDLAQKLESAGGLFREEPVDELLLPYFGYILAAGLALLVLGYAGRLISRPAGRPRTGWPLLLAAGFVLLASVAAVFATGFTLSHYLLFLPFPSAFLAAALLATLCEYKLGRAFGLALVCVYLVSAVTVASRLALEPALEYVRGHSWSPVLSVGSLEALDEGNPWLARRPEEPDPVAGLICRYSRPGDKLVVWGWMDRYYVLAGRRPGTGFCEVGHFLLHGDRPFQDYNYRLYLKQFDQARPSVFVDAVDPESFIIDDPKEYAHERYPELRDRIAANYVQVAEMFGARVYVSKDRLAELPPTEAMTLALRPVATHQTEWQGGVARGAGGDSFLVFAPTQPQWATAISIRCTPEANAAAGQLRLFWKRPDQPDFPEEQGRALDLKRGAGEQTLTFPVAETIEQIRVHPDTRAGACTLHAIVLHSPFTFVNEKGEYPALIEKVRETARLLLPQGATVLVVSHGDDDLLQLPGRKGQHFPQNASGSYLGYTPDEDEAITRLEALRAKGGQFLLFPKTEFWWLQEYPAFRRHLDTHYPRIHQDPDCIIYQLSRRSAP